MSGITFKQTTLPETLEEGRLAYVGNVLYAGDDTNAPLAVGDFPPMWMGRITVTSSPTTQEISKQDFEISATLDAGTNEILVTVVDGDTSKLAGVLTIIDTSHRAVIGRYVGGGPQSGKYVITIRDASGVVQGAVYAILWLIP